MSLCCGIDFVCAFLCSFDGKVDYGSLDNLLANGQNVNILKVTEAQEALDYVITFSAYNIARPPELSSERLVKTKVNHVRDPQTTNDAEIGKSCPGIRRQSRLPTRNQL